MSKLIVCSCLDRKLEAFGAPFFVAAVGQAVRSFSDEVNRRADDNMLNRHPEDFELYQLGEFDPDSGLFDVGAPVLLLKAVSAHNS